LKVKNIEIQSLTSDKNSSDTSVLIRNYKTAIDQYKKRILKARENLSTNKKINSLMLTTDSSTQQKEKLISGNDELVWGSFDKLEKAKRATIEMENVSIEISRDLNSQSEKMRNIGTKVNETNHELTVSSGLITRMMRLQRRNKIIIALFSVGLITTFLVILFVKLTSGSKSSTNQN
jgi:hypothetical protein